MSAPEHLSKESKKIWNFIVPKQAKTPPRQALLQVALESLDRANEARELINTEGLLVSAKENGLSHAHPLLKVEKDSRALFAKLWGQLGLNFESHNFGGMI